MSLYPVFLKVAGEHVLVVGAGALAQSKIEALVQAGASVSVVAPRAKSNVANLAEDGRVRWLRRGFEPADVQQEKLVFAATGIQAVDRAVAQECQRRRVFCNAVDDPPFCDFYTPAVVKRGDLQIAISTNGHSPALAQQLRQTLEQQFGDDWGERLEALGRKRQKIRRSVSPGAERNRLLHQAASEALAESAHPDGVPAAQPRTNFAQRALDAIVHWLQTEDDRVALI
jgi:precorrin-2 dehydrogenase/sirohydrochlorin ferrochelatase